MVVNEKEPLVSVVIPFYSNVAWLEEAVDSVLHQTYSNREIIVINDGSKENVEHFFLKYKDCITYIYQNNSGPGSARNNGIKHSNGELIAFLDSDDIWLPQKLEVQVKYMENNSSCMWSHCAYETFGNHEQKVIRERKMKGEMFPRCFSTCRIATPCVIIRKVVFEDTEVRFSESMRYGQDFYLWILLCNKYKLGYLDKILCKVRMRGGNASKRAYVMLKSKGELWSNLDDVKCIDKKSLPTRVRIAYGLCFYNFRIVNLIAKFIKNEAFVELGSRALYVVPYLILKAKE